MSMPMNRRRAILAGSGLLVAALGLLAFLKLRSEVRKAVRTEVRTSESLQYAPLQPPALQVQRWGGGEVEALAVSTSSLLSAGRFGVADETGDLSSSLPGLHASALALWRGHPVAALAAGGLFLRRNAHWEEVRTGYGLLHVRMLLESPGGELLIGAREGLFRAAWGATRLERLDAAPVKALALGDGGNLVAGGEEGLRLFSGNRVTVLPSPDPWVEWVGLSGGELAVITPLGLARGPLEGTLAPVPGGEEASSAATLDGHTYAVAEGRLLRFESAGRPAEEILPAAPRRVFAAAGMLFVDTATGLFRRGTSGWTLARPRPLALPPGSCHVNALAFHDSQLVVGLFNAGLAVADAGSLAKGWWTVPGSEAWGVNALLSAGGRLHVASLRGTAQFDGRRLLPAEGRESGAAFSLASTRDGVAVGYGQGVLLPGARFVSAFHGLPGNQALALVAGESLFVGTPSGLGAVNGSRVAWRVSAGDGKLPNPWVTALVLQGDDLLIGTYGGGVTRRLAHRTDPSPVGTYQPFLETEGLKVNPGCLVEGGGRYYLGTDGRGLYRLSADGKVFQPLKVPLPSPHITAILPSPDALFVGTDEGLVRIPLPIADEGV